MPKAAAPTTAPDATPTVATRRRTSNLRCLAIVAIPAVLLILGKLKLIERGTGLYHAAAGEFSLLERLSFFRGDLLAVLVIVPLGTLLLARLTGRLRTPLLALLSITAIWILAVEFLTHRVIGRFFSPYLLENSIRFGADQIDIAGVYAPKEALIRPVVLSLAVLVAAWWASGTVKVKPVAEPVPPRRWRRVVGWSAVIVSVAVTALAWGPWAAPPVLTRGVVSYLWASMTQPAPAADLASLTPEQVATQFRQFTRSPQPLPDPPHFGAAAGCDVITIVLETAPASVADTLSDQEMPNLAQLKQRGWVAQQHYSTYPFTSYAMWSIMTSWYPSNAHSNYPEFDRTRTYPGLMQSLKSAGYATALYVPDWFTGTVDRPMYELAGVDKHLYAYELLTDEMKADPEYSQQRGPARVGDRVALERLLADITAWHAKDQRYAAHFAPQLGHAPWVNFTDAPKASTLERGRSVLMRQDAYIGRIINHLRSLGRLDSTVILVTGDHGIRTWREDRQFRPGILEDVSFRVPMTLYCPPAIKQRQDLPWLTSHIDIAPSILDLLGISQGRSSEQGSPLWDARLKDRTTFFFSRNYHGADGYHVDGTFYAWKPIEDVVFRSDRMTFRAEHIVRDAPTREQIKERLRTMAGLQKEWIRLAPPRPGAIDGASAVTTD